jgi:hypothetical protein
VFLNSPEKRLKTYQKKQKAAGGWVGLGLGLGFIFIYSRYTGGYVEKNWRPLGLGPSLLAWAWAWALGLGYPGLRDANTRHRAPRATDMHLGANLAKPAANQQGEYRVHWEIRCFWIPRLASTSFLWRTMYNYSPPAKMLGGWGSHEELSASPEATSKVTRNPSKHDTPA